MIADAERLAAFEAMLTAVQAQLADVVRKMERLKSDGREKTVTFRQLLGEKLQLQSMLTLYEFYGLIGEKPEHKATE